MTKENLERDPIHGFTVEKATLMVACIENITVSPLVLTQDCDQRPKRDRATWAWAEFGQRG